MDEYLTTTTIIINNNNTVDFGALLFGFVLITLANRQAVLFFDFEVFFVLCFSFSFDDQI